MSRESHERNAFNQYEDNFARGAGDPDYYQNPAEPVSVRIVKGEVIQDVRPAHVIIAEALRDRPF